jgi:hypothetical protein
MTDDQWTDPSIGVDVEKLREAVTATDGMLPNAAVLPLTFIRAQRPELADALECEYGPLDPMSAILIVGNTARPLTEDDWP